MINLSVSVCVCVLVAEFGDHDEDVHGSTDYISQCKLLPKQTDKQDDLIADVHRSLM